MPTDIFDEDLPSSSYRTDPVVPPRATTASSGAESFHERRSREIPEEIAHAGDQVERLKRQQEELERKKKELQEQRRRMERFEHDRHALLEKLRRDSVLIVRHGEQASKVSTLCMEVGASFSQLHRDLDALVPKDWSEEEYEQRLTEALAKVDAATAEYRKAMDRVAAIGWKSSAVPSDSEDAFSDGSSSHGGLPRGFCQWFLAGLAFTLPLILVAAIVATVVFVFRMQPGL